MGPEIEQKAQHAKIPHCWGWGLALSLSSIPFVLGWWRRKWNSRMVTENLFQSYWANTHIYQPTTWGSHTPTFLSSRQLHGASQLLCVWWQSTPMSEMHLKFRSPLMCWQRIPALLFNQHKPFCLSADGAEAINGGFLMQRDVLCSKCIVRITD